PGLDDAMLLRPRYPGGHVDPGRVVAGGVPGDPVVLAERAAGVLQLDPVILVRVADVPGDHRAGDALQVDAGVPAAGLHDVPGDRQRVAGQHADARQVRPPD